MAFIDKLFKFTPTMSDNELNNEIATLVSSEGYSSNIIFYREAAEIILTLQKLGVDLNKYHIKEMCALNLECNLNHRLSAFYTIYTEGHDLFMYEKYAFKCSDVVCELLARSLVNGDNYTRLLDYSKLDSEESIRFLTALNLGISTKEAFTYCRHLKVDSIIYKGLRSRYSPDKALELSNKLSSNVIVDDFFELIDTYKLPLETAIKVSRSFEYGDMGMWESIVEHTKGKCVPTNPNFYGEYLTYLTGKCYDRFFYNAVLEACYLSNIQMPSIHSLETITNADIGYKIVRCILQGIDVNIYLNLNLTDRELMETLTVASRTTKNSTKKHIGSCYIQTRFTE